MGILHHLEMRSPPSQLHRSGAAGRPWKKAQTSTQSTNLPGTALSNNKIAGGLKEALTKSTGTAVASTGRVDGYFKNQAIKILLPSQLQTVGKGMRMMGMGAQVDELELSMNRAAKQAALSFAVDKP